jgi:outer membrane protein TolC
VASARLARVLRLNPSSVVVPLEPPHLQVALVSPESVVDDLIPVGLLNRPELASQRALVQATLERLRQERVRPLLPSVVLEGGGPGGALSGALFGGGTNDNLNTWGGRFDADVGLVWTLNNLGLGNRALVRARAAERQQALIQLFDIQDRVAQDVVQAHAELQAAAGQVRDAQTEVTEGSVTFQGSLKGLRDPRRVGDVLVMIVRPQEAVAALQQLDRAYQNYFAAVSAFNRSQFLLYHALGFPSRIVASERPFPARP